MLCRVCPCVSAYLSTFFSSLSIHLYLAGFSDLPSVSFCVFSSPRCTSIYPLSLSLYKACSGGAGLLRPPDDCERERVSFKDPEKLSVCCVGMAPLLFLDTKEGERRKQRREQARVLHDDVAKALQGYLNAEHVIIYLLDSSSPASPSPSARGEQKSFYSVVNGKELRIPVRKSSCCPFSCCSSSCCSLLLVSFSLELTRVYVQPRCVALRSSLPSCWHSCLQCLRNF